MYRSNDLTDEPSRLKQFSWEQWDNQFFAVLYRPGVYGLDRYVVKRYIEQILSHSERWRQFSPYFSNVSPPVRTYTLTAHEADLMQKILDYHLHDSQHFTIKPNNDQLIEYEDMLDFIRRAQEATRASNSCSTHSNRPVGAKKNATALIPSIHSSYVLPPSAKSMFPAATQPTTSKISPVKPIVPRAAPTIMNSSSSIPFIPPQVNKTSTSGSTTNGHVPSNPTTVRAPTNVPVKSTTTTAPMANIVHMPKSSSLFGISNVPELLSPTIQRAKIDGHGWVQINNVFLPFVIKQRQRLIPYQVLVSCKILETDELRATLTQAATADRILMNQMIRDCKINNEEILENAPLISVYHVLIGTKNLVYVKLLPKDNPTSKINRQFKSVLALSGGCLCINNRTVPYVRSSNRSYIPLDDVLAIYPNLHSQLKPLARVPRTHELDYLQLVQMYFDERELPSDTLLIDMEDLNQRQIISSKNLSLIEYHDLEKVQLEQQIAKLTQSTNRKRELTESNEHFMAHSKFKASSSTAPTANPMIRTPTGYYPNPATSTNSSYPPQYQQNHWLSSNYGQNGRTH